MCRLHERVPPSLWPFRWPSRFVIHILYLPYGIFAGQTQEYEEQEEEEGCRQGQGQMMTSPSPFGCDFVCFHAFMIRKYIFVAQYQESAQESFTSIFWLPLKMFQ